MARRLAAVPLALLLLAQAAAGLVAPPAPPPPAAPELPALPSTDLLGFLRAHAPVPGEALERMLDALPFPFGPSEGARLLAALDARPAPPPGPSVLVTGTVNLTEDWSVHDLTLENATVNFLRTGLVVRVAGRLAATDSVLRTAGFGSSWGGTVEALRAIDVRRSTFEGVTLVARHDGGFQSPSQVLDSAFRRGAVGLIADRADLEVARTSFHTFSGPGIDVVAAHGAPEKGPRVHNSTIEMTRYAIQVEGRTAGQYRHNLLRGNFFGVFCTSPGATDGQGVLRKPSFRQNNIYTNFGEALSGLRGINIVSALGNLTVPDSACDHDGAYLGPSGSSRDTVFLSSADTLTNVSSNLNPSSAPALPLPLTEITTSVTWGPGAVAVEGPVVVNAGGTLTVEGAELRGVGPVGAKANGKVKVRNSTLDHFNVLVLRNDGDEGVNLNLGGPEAPAPVGMYRCNCSLRDSRVQYGNSRAAAVSSTLGLSPTTALGVAVAGGLLTDDTAWRPEVRNTTIRGGGVGLTLADVKPTVAKVTVEGGASGIFHVLSTTTLDGSTVRGAAAGLLSVVGTLTSTNNVYEAGTAGVLGLLDTMTFSRDVFAGYELGLVPLLPATFTVSLSNLTFNAVGALPALGVASFTSVNLFDNYLMGLLTLPIDTGDVEVPTGITCTTCWGPADEARFGNVTYTSALASNDVPKPPWAGKERIAKDGQTLDLRGTLDAPAVARAGGTLRVVNDTLDLAQRFPVGAKGAGVGGGTTGKVLFDNATLQRGSFVALNSSTSRIVHTRFTGFPATAVGLMWNGGSFQCVEVQSSGVGFRLNLQKGDPLTLRRLAVREATGAVLGLQRDIIVAQAGSVEDSGIAAPGGGGLLHRLQPGDAQLHRSNLLGSPGATGARDDAEHLNGLAAGPFNASLNWWADPLGPNRGGTRFRSGQVAPVLAPHAAAAHAPAPCASFAVLTAAPADDAEVHLEDRTIDPSALGIVERRWDFGDGSTLAASGARVAHRFPDGGTYTVTMTARSASGAEATATRAVQVAHTPPRPAFGAAATVETEPAAFSDLSTHGNPNDAPPDGWAYAWDFAGEGSSTLRGPSFRFADGGTKAVKLTVHDNDGLAASSTRTVAVAHVPPVADFAVQGALETDTYALQDRSTHPNAPTDQVVQRTWRCSDGFTATGASVTHRFADGGTPSCTLTVRDDDGLEASATRTVPVAHVPPRAAFDAPEGTELDTLAFRDASTHPNPADTPPAGWRFRWAFGDGGGSDARDAARRFADGGTYTATLTATDDDGQEDTATRAVRVAHVAPVPAFGFEPPTPGVGEEVAFTDRSTHPNAPTDRVVAWQWDFGDGATSDEREPRHAYGAPGQKEVTLTTTDDDGLQARVTVRVPVGNIPPVPSFSWSPEEPTDLEEAQLTDASTDADGEVVSWAWDFGDGATSAERHPRHRWADDGVYTITLTVTDDRGASASLALPVVVRNVAPTASFGHGPPEPTVTDEVQFTDASLDPDGTVVSWHWTFGDGATSEARHPAHQYFQGGDYTVRLTVTDDDGDSATRELALHVCETGVQVLPGPRLRVEVCPRLRVTG